LFACTKELPTPAEATTKPENCEFEFELDDNVVALDESLNLIHYNSSKALTFLDERGGFHTFNTKSKGQSISCLHDWVCPADTSIKKTYWEHRTLFDKELTSESHEIKFKLSSYAALNEKFPQKYADVLNITIYPENEYHHSVLKYIINQRTDETATNQHLKFNLVKDIGNTMYKNVYENNVGDFVAYFNTEFGFLGYRNNKTGDRLTLAP